MPTLSEYRLECRRLLHDSTGKFWSNVELNSYINDARSRVCSDTGCLRRLVTGYLTPGLEQYAIGAVSGISIVSGGSGYVSPSIVFSGGSPSVSAAATPVVSGGVITGLTFTNYGEGYLSAPTVTVLGSSDGVASLTVTAPGGGYWTAPALGFSGGGGAGAAGTVSLSGMIAAPFNPGFGFSPGDEFTLVGGTFTRAATLRVLSVILGAINVLQVVDGGDYSVVPGATITSGGLNATGPINISAGGATVEVVWGLGVATATNPGTGYTTPPAVAVTGGSANPIEGSVTAALGAAGTGASIIASVIPMKTLDILNITPIWGNQRIPLRYMPYTEFNARMRTWIPNPQRPVVWSRYGTSGGTAFIQPVPDQNYTTEFDTCVTPEPLVSDDDEDLIQYPYTSPVAYYACWKAKLKQQSYAEGSVFLEDYKKKILEAQASVQMRRIPNPFYGYTGA